MLRLTSQKTTEDGVELTLEGGLNPDFASRLLFAGAHYHFDEGGAVVLKLKLNVAQPAKTLAPIVQPKAGVVALGGGHFGLDRRSPKPWRSAPGPERRKSHGV